MQSTFSVDGQLQLCQAWSQRSRGVETIWGASLNLVQPRKPSNTFFLAGSPRNVNQRPLLWVVLLLAAVALVLGVGVFVGLHQAKRRSSRKATEGEGAQ